MVVVARRKEGVVVLECQTCASEESMPAGPAWLDQFNAFLATHDHGPSPGLPGPAEG